MKKTILFILLCQFSSSEAYPLSERRYDEIFSPSYKNPIASRYTSTDKSPQAEKSGGNFLKSALLRTIGIATGLSSLIYNPMKEKNVILNPTTAVPGIGSIMYKNDSIPQNYTRMNDSIPQNFANTNWTNFRPISEITDSPLVNPEANQEVIGKIPSEKSIVLFK